MFILGNPVCPICHSDVVKGYKIHTSGKWWSRCISGLDHGLAIFDDVETDIGIDYENIYFADDGEVIYKDQRFAISHQEYRDV